MEILRGNLADSLSFNGRNYARKLSEKEQEDIILKQGKPNAKYYKGMEVKKRFKKVAHSRYGPDMENPKNVEVVNVSVPNLRQQYGCENVKEWVEQDPSERVFIGKEMPGLVAGTVQTKWSTTFRISGNLTREEQCCNYEKKVRQTDELWNNLHELENKTLGCACSNRYALKNQKKLKLSDSEIGEHICHGNVLKYLCNVKGTPKDDGGYGLLPDCNELTKSNEGERDEEYEDEYS